MVEELQAYYQKERVECDTSEDYVTNNKLMQKNYTFDFIQSRRKELMNLEELKGIVTKRNKKRREHENEQRILDMITRWDDYKMQRYYSIMDYIWMVKQMCKVRHLIMYITISSIFRQQGLNIQ